MPETQSQSPEMKFIFGLMYDLANDVIEGVELLADVTAELHAVEPE